MRKRAFVPIKTFREKLSEVKFWFGLTCALLSTEYNKVLSLLREKRVSPWVKNPLSAQWNGLTDSSSKAGKKNKNQHRRKPRSVLQPHVCQICSQMNFVESLLLMRTSSSRSLALTCLYSPYSAASGERSSFCTFLWERDDKWWDKPSVKNRGTTLWQFLRIFHGRGT